MSDAINFFDSFGKSLKDGINVSLIAEVLKYDPINMIADIQPVHGGLPPILDVPVSLQKAGAFFIRMPFKKGDKVVVVFNDYPLDGVSEGGNSLDDAMIVSGVSSGAMPTDNSNDLLIAHEEMKTKIVIDESGKVTIETGEQDINLSSQSGNINLSTQTGSVNLSSQTGGVNLTSSQGDISASSSEGNVSMSSSDGNVSVSGKDASESW